MLGAREGVDSPAGNLTLVAITRNLPLLRRCATRSRSAGGRRSPGLLLRGRALMAERLKRIGTRITRYGLVIVLLWIGGMKFTAYEAQGIEPLVANSPLMGWVYELM